VGLEPRIYGDLGVLQACAEATGLPAPSSGHVVAVTSLSPSEYRPGQIAASSGQAAYQYIIAAIDAALAGDVSAVCTLPIHKESLAAAGIPFPGHTEILADRTKTDDYLMMLTAPEITCSLVTAHVGYWEVPQLLTTQAILQAIRLTGTALRQMRNREPRMIVCGLNPHAGEHGLFGQREEERIISPAIELARAEGWNLLGPLPPDTAFLPKYRHTTDAYICMYHDQGLIPLKALAFDDGVNVTLGLPIIRTSVDHGTAFDIAWKGEASDASLRQAYALAVQLVNSHS
jgi:4-hydroxythreonine-4-phosphate dehydrogenase